MTTVPRDDNDTQAALARRRIGRMLSTLREAARDADGKPITVEKAAAVVEIARPTMWRIEQGRDGVRIKNLTVNTLCDLYGATDKQRAELLAWAVVSRQRGWFHPYNDVLPAGFDIYIGLESAAADITAYEADRVHGLLQSEQYAHEMLRIPGFDNEPRDDDEIERRVKVRLRRQEILTRASPEPTRLDCILGEAVLRRRVGTAAVTAQQLTRIAELGELPNVTIRVIPFDAGLHQGVVTGPFARLRFAQNSEPPTVYADSFMGHLLMSKTEQVSRFDAAITAMRASALDPAKSRDLIHLAAKEHLRA